VDTGRKWVDGRTIYRKVLRGTVNIATGTVNVAHGISGLTTAWELIRFSQAIKLASATNTNGQNTIIHREPGGSQNWAWFADMDQVQMQIAASYPWGNSWYTVVVEYVK
jgi:hypothetical protein